MKNRPRNPFLDEIREVYIESDESKDCTEEQKEKILNQRAQKEEENQK